MDAVLNVVFTFPTIFFTGLVVFALLGWLAIVLNLSKMRGLDTLLKTHLGADEQGVATLPFLRLWQRDQVPLSVGWIVWAVVSWLLCIVLVAIIYPYLSSDQTMIMVALALLVVVPLVGAWLSLALLPVIKPWVEEWLAREAEAYAKNSTTSPPDQT